MLAPVAPAMSTQAGPQLAADVAGLPLTIVADPAARKTDLMAIMYSGDGGWAGLDRAVAGQLAAAGVPVVGVDSLDYFWTARTPGHAGGDLARIVSHFSRQWGRPRVILLGYSFGADDLPYIVGALPPALRPMISRVSLLGLSPTADFQFHLTSWLDLSSATARPTVPAIEQLKGLPMQCIRGADESDSACTAIPAGYASQVLLPGGHHFDGNAALIAQSILHGLTS
jgi:type IV secretory pathway VirJ component